VRETYTGFEQKELKIKIRNFLEYLYIKEEKIERNNRNIIKNRNKWGGLYFIERGEIQ